MTPASKNGIYTDWIEFFGGGRNDLCRFIIKMFQIIFSGNFQARFCKDNLSIYLKGLLADKLIRIVPSNSIIVGSLILSMPRWKLYSRMTSEVHSCFDKSEALILRQPTTPQIKNT